MSEFVDFVLHGKIDGVEITPSTIDFSFFNEFNQQVEEFVAGKAGGKLDGVRVEIEKSSYKLRLILPLVLLASVDTEVKKLAREDSLGELDDKRAKVIKSWQFKARANEDLYIEVRTSRSIERNETPVRISHETNYRQGEPKTWVAIEKYLYGYVFDMGGDKPNVHLRLPGSGKIVIVDSNEQYLREKEKGVLYQNAVLHIRAEEEAKTGELRKIRLVEFAEHNPRYDEAALDSFAEAGKKAWADVPDGAAWVRELRGG